jgi:HlyD family secretion protein
MTVPPAVVPPPPAAMPPPAGPAPAGAVDLATLLAEPDAVRWYRRRWVWIAAGLAVLAAAGMWWWLAQRAAHAAPAYNTQPAARGDLTLLITANGTIQPTRSINIGSELSGTVLAVNVDVNDQVKKGQVMVVLDTAKLRAQILRSEAAVAAARAKVAQTDATTLEAKATLGRLEAVAALSGGKVPSKTELDTARAVVARAIADAGSAAAGVQDSLAALSTDRTNLSKASIAAPADGVVLTRTVDPGNAVAASLQAVTLFTLAEDLSKLRLWVYVDEADVGSVKVGQDATFTVSAYLSRNFPARITRVGFGSTITDNVVTYLTYLDVDNADLSLRPGMTATATITSTQRKDVLMVPNTALRFMPTAAGSEAAAKKGIGTSLMPRMPSGGTRRSAAAGASTASARQVWVLRDGTPAAVAVTPGISDGRMTEITAGDLKEGMLVITNQKTAAGK